MYKTTLKIDGMACSMCESHINDAVRNAFNVKKVSSSHKSGTIEIISKNELDGTSLKNTIEKTGYKVISLSSAPYEKKRFSFFG